MAEPTSRGARAEPAQIAGHPTMDQLRPLIDAISDGYVLIEAVRDPAGHLVDYRLQQANPAFARLIGSTPQGITGRTMTALVPDLYPGLTAFDTALRTGQSQRMLHHSVALNRRMEITVLPVSSAQAAMLVKDVTERKQLEEVRDGLSAELATANDLLRCRTMQMARAEQLARIGYWNSDLNTGEVLWSAGLSYLLGFSPEPQQRAAGDIYAFVHPEDRAVVGRAVAVAINSQAPFNVEFRAHALDGTEHCVRIYGEIKFAPDGRPTTNFGVVQDVTELKQIEIALRESESRFRRQAAELELFYHSAPVGLFLVDTALRFLRVNERLAAIGGVPPERYLNRTVREVMPEFGAVIEPLLRHVLETGEPVLDAEVSVKLPAEGTERAWISQCWPFTDDGGNVVGVNVLAEEVTERRRLDETRRREHEFRTLAENSIDAIARFDRSLRRIYVNAAIEKLLGRPRNEILGKTNRELGLPQELADYLDREMTQAFASGRPRSIEAMLPTPKGERWLDSRLVPEPDPEGKARTLLAISRDITERKHFEQALQHSELKYRTLVEDLYEGVWMIDEAANTTFVNQRMAELLGYAVDEMMGRNLFSCMDAHAAEAAKRNLALGQNGVRAEYEFEFRRKDGEAIWTHIATTPLYDEQGRYRGALAGVIDISAKKRTEEILRRREQEFEALAERSPDVIARVDRSLRLRYINPAIERFTKRSREELLGKTPSELEPVPGERVLRERILRKVFETGQEQVLEHEISTAAGTFHLQSRLVPEFDPNGEVTSVLVVDRDITDLKKAQVALEQLTLHDPLTDVANRRYLTQFIEREWRREARHHHPIALIMADIDHFKAYNDRYGHQQGDLCLQRVAQVLSKHLRRPTDLLVRYGGEEFAVLLLETELDAAVPIAESMRQSVFDCRFPHEASPVAPVVTISLGVAAAPAQLVTFDRLMDAADSALYVAKQNGRNRTERSDIRSDAHTPQTRAMHVDPVTRDDDPSHPTP